MDKEAECHLKHHPQGRKENVLIVKGLDIVSGTPIVDLKPYTPQYDRVTKARLPRWVNKLVF